MYCDVINPLPHDPATFTLFCWTSLGRALHPVMEMMWVGPDRWGTAYFMRLVYWLLRLQKSCFALRLYSTTRFNIVISVLDDVKQHNR